MEQIKNVIVVENVAKIYGNFSALKGVSFVVREREIIGFLGLNGAGKTTTMNILTGCISYTKGRVEILGCDVFDNPLRAKQNIGYLPENPPLYQNMTVFEYLKFVCEIKKVKEIKKEVKRVVDLCGLKGKESKLIFGLSKGFKQRVGIAQALVSSPKILILDEPTSGLDPAQIIEVRKLIRALKKDHTVILSTHILSEVQAVCDRIIIINNGEIVADETEENLLKSYQNNYFVKVFCESKEKLELALEEFKEFLNIKKVRVNVDKTIDFEVVLKQNDSDFLLNISNSLMKNKIPIVEFKENHVTLEQLFVKLIGKKIKGEII